MDLWEKPPTFPTSEAVAVRPSMSLLRGTFRLEGRTLSLELLVTFTNKKRERYVTDTKDRNLGSGFFAEKKG